jgi:hypothetical protein
LKDSDSIIFTIGTLIDTSYTKGRTPGEPGTYEHMNRDSLLSVGKQKKKQKKNK